MAKLKVPSLQHLARNWRNDAQRVKKVLINLADNSPIFNYNPLFGAVQDMLIFNQPYEEIVAGMHKGIKRRDILENFLEVLPLIRDHFQGIAPTFVQEVGRRYYPVGRGLMVPFEPPLIYGLGGQIQFPWFSFWRRNSLSDERLSLFVTVVDDLLNQDPDLENAKFNILDFSISGPRQPRTLTVVDAREIPRVSEEIKVRMLLTFAEGYRLAEAELAGAAMAKDKQRPSESKEDKDQQDLFDSD